MQDSDKKQFAHILRASFLTLGGESPEVDVMRMWWATLQQFAIDDVRQAFGEYVRRGKYQPKPADIIEIIERLKPDGRPLPDEAWAMVPRDEAQSVIMSDEIATAMQVAQPLLDAGDQIAARMAFRDAYTRAVEENRRVGKQPRWFPSLGHDPHGRAKAIADAVEKKRITMDRAETILPHAIDEVKKILGVDDKTARLTDESAREKVLSLARSIGK
jgi:hypothetical protein